MTLAFDAQLAATELVRRCERRIGELVREGQRQGTIRAQGYNGDARHRGDDHPLSVEAITGITGGKTLADTRSLADAPQGRFDQAIAEAREEGNLSRANVVRGRTHGSVGSALTIRKWIDGVAS